VSQAAAQHQDATSRALAAAHRLRLLQAELADQSPEDRAGHLEDELERLVRAVGTGQQGAFLAELAGCFDPGVGLAGGGAVGGGGSGGGGVGSVAGGGAGPVAPVAQSLSDLATELMSRWGEAEERERAEVRAALVAGGVAPPAPKASGGGELSEAVAAQWRKALGLGPGDKIDVGRVQELGAMMAELLLSKERRQEGVLEVLLGVWRNLARDDRDRRGMSLATLASQASIGAGGVTTQRVSEEAREFKRFVVALVLAVKQLSDQHAKRHMLRFSVEAIEADAPSAGFAVSKEAAYWRHYKALMEGVSEETLAAELAGQYVKIVGQFRGNT
jgi:hypothetical protein